MSSLLTRKGRVKDLKQRGVNVLDVTTSNWKFDVSFYGTLQLFKRKALLTSVAEDRRRKEEITRLSVGLLHPGR